MRNLPLLALLLGSLSLAGCSASKPPEIAYDDAPRPAVIVHQIEFFACGPISRVHHGFGRCIVEVSGAQPCQRFPAVRFSPPPVLP